MRQRKMLPIYPTLSEIHAMIDAADNPRDRMLVELLWNTGGRISEVLSIRVGDVNANGIRMRNLKQGQPAEKFVFCGPDFLAELHEYCQGMMPGEFLITHLDDKQKITRKHGWSLFKALALRANAMRRRMGETESEAIWPHTARHGYAINLLSQGVPVTAVGDQLGHSSLSSTQIYTALTDPHRQKMVAGVRF